MSTGLLKGLAARALGMDAPLRSQRVRSFDGPGADEAPAVEAKPLATAAQTAASRQPAALTSAGRVSAESQRVAVEGRAGGPMATAPAVVVTSHRQTPTQARDDLRALAQPLQPAPVPAKPAPAVLLPQPQTAVVADSQQHAHQTAHAGSGAAAMTVKTIPAQTPAPLLPLSAPVRLLPAAPGSNAVHRWQPPAAAGAQAPTEVHVSIGRVELTALAPATVNRAPARREAPAGRSLADYLRGPGCSTGKRPA